MPKKLVVSPLCPSIKVTEEEYRSDLAILEMDKAVAHLDRRRFFSSLTALGAVAATAGLLSAPPSARAQAATGPSIVDVLNFALNLEYLEANLYIAASGSDPISVGDGGGAPVLGAPSGSTLGLNPQTLATFQNLAIDETHHITLLRALIFQLGGTPINQPEIDYTLGGKMSITNVTQLLAVTRQFTAVGTSAYTGGAQYLVSNPFVLTGAAQILGTESQHLGGVNFLCDALGVTSPPVDALDYPPVVPNTYFTLTPTNALSTGPALGPVRTPAQVLGIVYGVSTASTTTPPAGITAGGFFPKGLNGNVKST
ncbi:ferritin-like domain-containing protein [Acidipila sp. EB88]|uniref:ferritin-like domain-containing protein n=1 Tax=Acidipila sp. EB88 TaxID=2305226 RepID=UPI000F5F4CBA|nr:ferritin-like domain-containing protein [Acidipila sp. EB88]RRA47611.1 ferritin-like domain-containing protein [Acidipila sp. EB88]